MTSLDTHQVRQQPQSDEEDDLQYFDCLLEVAEETLLADGFVDAQDIAVQIEAIRHSVTEIREGQLTANSCHPQ